MLEFEAGIATETIAKLLFVNDRPEGPSERWRLRQGEIVVIDEAAMVASADLARVVNLATEARAKVVLVGDHRQLGAVEAGGLFRLLASETEAAELSGVRRFHAEWERAASLRLRDGDRAVIEDYLQHGRVVGGERAVMVEEALLRWQLARAQGESVVVCAADYATVEELAMRARAARMAAAVHVRLWLCDSESPRRWTGSEATRNACGVLVARLQGNSWAPTPSTGHLVNVGTTPKSPFPPPIQGGGGRLAVGCRLGDGAEPS